MFLILTFFAVARLFKLVTDFRNMANAITRCVATKVLTLSVTAQPAAGCCAC